MIMLWINMHLVGHFWGRKYHDCSHFKISVSLCMVVNSWGQTLSIIQKMYVCPYLQLVPWGLTFWSPQEIWNVASSFESRAAPGNSPWSILLFFQKRVVESLQQTTLMTLTGANSSSFDSTHCSACLSRSVVQYCFQPWDLVILSPSLKLHTPSLTQLGKIEHSQEHVYMQTQNGE